MKGVTHVVGLDRNICHVEVGDVDEAFEERARRADTNVWIRKPGPRTALPHSKCLTSEPAKIAHSNFYRRGPLCMQVIFE